MADIFVSYANEDRDRAGKLASAFMAEGWSVWWDRKIIPGQTFDEAIERELEHAKSVVVLWSSHSITSEWVKNEAAVASERGVLLPAAIENVKLPLEFRRRQTVDLTGWNGESSHSGFQALCEGVASTIGDAAWRQPIPLKEKQPHWNRSWLLATAALIAVAGSLAVYSLGPWRTSPPPTNDRFNTIASFGSKKPLDTAVELADLVVGTYLGNVIADSKGGSRSDVILNITKLDRSTVRVTSEYPRLGTIDVALTRTGNQILNANGDTPFIVDLDQNPPSLLFDPHSEVAYRGIKR